MDAGSRLYVSRDGLVSARQRDEGRLSHSPRQMAGRSIILQVVRPGSEHNGVHHTWWWATGRVRCMVEGDVGSFDTRYERLTEHYRDLIMRGQLKAGDRFPSARELSEKHGVGRTTSGRVHGTLISVGLIEHRPGVGTFVLGPPPDGEQEVSALVAAAQKVVDAFDAWRSRAKPQELAEAVSELRDALR